MTAKMPNINQLALDGHIEGQPVQRYGYVELTVACRRRFRDEQGQWVEQINRVRVHTQAQPVESRAGIQDAPYPGPLTEGLPVFITGRIRSQPPTHDRLFLEARHVEVLKQRETDDEEETD